MRQVSGEFELNPGFEVKGVGEIKSCRVKLLTATERELVEQAGIQDGMTKIVAYNESAAQKKLPKMTDAQQAATIARAMRKRFLMSSVHCFGRIEDPVKIEAWWGLLIYTDEEVIDQEVQDLVEKFRTAKRAGSHICSNCGEQTDCPRSVERTNKGGVVTGDRRGDDVARLE